MNILTLSDLQEPDARVRRFTPLGLSLGGMLTAEDAAEFQQSAVASAELVEGVPGGTRASFERLRTLHAHGLLCYETFTAVVDLAPRVADLALRERFLAFHGDTIVTITRDGSERDLPIASVGQLVAVLRQEKLRLRDWPSGERFDGAFGQLLRWARRQGLLSGQRARHSENLLRDWRNLLAHPDGHNLVGPVDSARDIHDLVEIINRLWGFRTPGGRIYPAPVDREVLALAHRARNRSVGLAESLGYHSSLIDATVLLVRGVRNDDSLFGFDTAYETTQFPTELLWGPGSYADALTWLDDRMPEPDTVDYLDRWFVLRRDGTDVDLPRHPGVTAGLSDSARAGDWYAVCADFPSDAFTHVRSDHEPFLGPCKQCAADGKAHGSWTDVIIAMDHEGVDVTPRIPVPARMPSA